VAEWEKIMAQSTQNSWRDEAVTIVVLVPVCLVFVPGMEEIVKAGFDRLNELPEWYQYLVFPWFAPVRLASRASTSSGKNNEQRSFA
jgi:hypothetical protein